MTERQRQLDQRLDGVDDSETIEVDAAASLPQLVTLSGRQFVLNRLDDAESSGSDPWVIYPAQCPHQLGPLENAALINGVVRCPWHGYEFDVRTGACVSGSHCQFGRMPKITELEDRVQLRWV
ncbi:MAG: Rieske (2Fe-2S) protein [Pseudomonadales bacterium]|nr:Rieske (2Fe-2S) protein [Pseudomonadales bacterium]